MGLRSIQCTECRRLIGYLDDFNIDFQEVIAVFLCVDCKRTHTNLGVKDISTSTLNEFSGND